MKRTKTIYLAILAVLLAPMAANAAPITVYFDITIEDIGSDVDGLYAANGIDVGNTYSGNFVYDDTATNLASNTGNFDVWNYLSFSSNLPGVTSPASVTAIDLATDSWTIVANWVLAPSPIGFININFSGLFGYDGLLGSGLGHPILPPPVFDVPTATAGSFLRYCNQASECEVAFATTTLYSEPQNVPEPGTLALLGLGLVGMAARRRKKV